jgi:Amt family ammonium transporter
LAWLTDKPGLQTWLAARASFLQGLFRAGNIPEKAIGGVLGGLVAITASCDVTTPGYALAFGAIAGVAHNMAFDWLLHKGIDDPVGAIPVHLACGIVGTLLVSMAPLRAAADGPGWIQLIGVLTAAALTYSLATACFALLARLRWLTLTEAEARVWRD